MFYNHLLYHIIPNYKQRYSKYNHQNTSHFYLQIKNHKNLQVNQNIYYYLILVINILYYILIYSCKSHNKTKQYMICSLFNPLLFNHSKITHFQQQYHNHYIIMNNILIKLKVYHYNNLSCTIFTIYIYYKYNLNYQDIIFLNIKSNFIY